MKPINATITGLLPERASRLKSVSIPTSNNNRMMPISASSFMVVSGDTQPSSEGPMSKPANSSPINEGMPKRHCFGQQPCRNQDDGEKKKELMQFHFRYQALPELPVYPTRASRASARLVVDTPPPATRTAQC